MRYFKIVSGKGRVEMTENEISEMLQNSEAVLQEPSQLEILEEKVEKVSKLLDSLKNSELFKGALAAAEGQVEQNGDS